MMRSRLSRRDLVLRSIHGVGGGEITLDDLALVAELLIAASTRDAGAVTRLENSPLTLQKPSANDPR